MPLHDARYSFLVAQLTEARVGANLTQLEVAEQLRKPQSFVSKYESGERRLDVVEFIEIAQIVGLDLNAVLKHFLQCFPKGTSLEKPVKE
jgi:transcriptional regulator with XRE-family HTH domain